MDEQHYEQCIVSFIDVLGFRSLVDKKTASQLYRIMSRLKDATRPLELESKEQMKVLYDTGAINPTYCQSMSDAIVRVAAFDRKPNPEIGFRPNTDALYFELEDLVVAQMSLIEQGILVRGGVSIGEVFVDRSGGGLVFGPALIKAYDIEREEATFPRLVIDDALLEEFRRNPKLTQYGADEEATKELFSLLRTGEDGVVYVDYLGAGHLYSKSVEEYLAFLNIHKVLVENELRNSEGRIRRKFIWLKRYHNDVVDSLLRKSREREGFEKEYGAPRDGGIVGCIEGLVIS